MNYILLAILATSMLSANFFQEEDKQKHIAVTAIISVVGTTVAKEYGFSDMEAFWIGFASAMVVGVGKELYDDSFDMRDIGADAIGSVLGSTGTIVVYRF